MESYMDIHNGLIKMNNNEIMNPLWELPLINTSLGKEGLMGVGMVYRDKMGKSCICINKHNIYASIC